MENIFKFSFLNGKKFVTALKGDFMKLAEFLKKFEFCTSNTEKRQLLL